MSQNTTSGLKECLITCTCSCAECEYLYFRVQMPPWMRRTLAICHFELLNEYDTIELPFVVVWILNQLFPFRLLYIVRILGYCFCVGNILLVIKRHFHTANQLLAAIKRCPNQTGNEAVWIGAGAICLTAALCTTDLHHRSIAMKVHGHNSR